MPRTEARETASALTIPKSTLGVGIVGVSPVRGWATTAHIPALRALPNYEIRALSAHNAESARAAGEAFGVNAVFSDHEQLMTRPDIDVVAITVKVPHHRELVSAALAAGKAVYCEWPLGRDLDDARAMAALAAKQSVHTVVGFQSRQAPAIEFVQQLLRDGDVRGSSGAQPARRACCPDGAETEMARPHQAGRRARLQRRSCLRRLRRRHRQRDAHRARLRRRRPAPRGHRRYREVRGIRETRKG